MNRGFYRIINRISKEDEEFNPGLYSLFHKPNYIIRKALFDSKKKYVKWITGDILDIGCGNKPYEKIFVNAKNYTGMDTKSSGHKHDLENIDVYYDGKVFPFQDNTFDNAVSFQVLEHVEDIDLFLKEIGRVIKRNGYILFDMPFIWEEHELPYDFQRYTGQGITNLMKKHNLRLVKYERYCDGLDMIPQFINLYLRKLNQNALIYGIVTILFIFPMNLLGLLFTKLNIKFKTIYGGHIFLVQNKKEN